MATSFRRSGDLPVRFEESDADTGCPLRSAEDSIYLRDWGKRLIALANVKSDTKTTVTHLKRQLD